MTFQGKITEGNITLIPKHKLLYREEVAKLEGCDVLLSLEKKRDKKSYQQIKYYWGVVIPVIAEEIGYMKHEHTYLHKDLKDILYYEIRTDKLTGEEKKYLKSLKDATTKDAEDYFEAVRQWALSTHNIYVPLPNEVTQQAI